MYYVAQAESPFDRLRKGFAKQFRRARLAPGAPVRERRPARRKLNAAWMPIALARPSWLPLLLGSLITIGLFWLILPGLTPSRLTILLLNRGPLQPITVGVALMGLFAIAQRAIQGTAERRAANRALNWAWPQAPLSPAMGRAWIDEASGAGRHWVDGRLGRLIDSVASGEPTSMARDRLEQADRRALQELHQLPRVTLGALPLLGLGGTVLGLSGGMAQLSGFIHGATDLAGLREVLTNFSGSLATAFDATLLALALMAPLLVLAGAVRSRDETTLRLIDGLAESEWAR